ncbi:hypothetical protein MRB53_006095 [Persea americana]|uniref:Uncharacterized protein n=1 Tax=Persea americana TaxID=3435 RepID=A0ACC2MF65_PERAE|nr:hypothetical protein MRB53_006095 [Persea americana]
MQTLVPSFGNGTVARRRRAVVKQQHDGGGRLRWRAVAVVMPTGDCSSPDLLKSCLESPDQSLPCAQRPCFSVEQGGSKKLNP